MKDQNHSQIVMDLQPFQCWDTESVQLKCVDYASNCRLVVLILKSRKACWYGFCLFFVCLLWKQVGFQIKQEDVYKRQVVRILAQTLYKYSDCWLVRRKNCSGKAVLSVGFHVQVVQIRDYRFISVYECSSVPLPPDFKLFLYVFHHMWFFFPVGTYKFLSEFECYWLNWGILLVGNGKVN